MSVARMLTLGQVAELLTAASTQPDGGVPDLLHGGWYTTEQVADLIDVDASTLRRWRTASPPQGPPFVRMTSRVTLYSVPDVQSWLLSRRIDPAEAA